MFRDQIGAGRLSALLARRASSIFAVATACVGVAAVAAPTAQASGLLNPFGPACGTPVVSQPFTRWNDSNDYVLLQGSSFGATATGWTTNGAKPVPGGEPYGVGGSVSPDSLSIPMGSTASSPYMCIAGNYPTFRFFSRSTTPGAVVMVLLVYKTLAGPAPLFLGVITPNSNWEPTIPLLTGAPIDTLISNQVSLTFIAVAGSAEIDDVYVDPQARR